MIQRIFNHHLKEVVLFNDQDDTTHDSSSEEFLTFSEYKELACLWVRTPKEKEDPEKKTSSKPSLF